jgi:hypothetical protein
MTSEQMLEKLGVTPEQAEEYKTLVLEFKAKLPSPLKMLYEKTHSPVPVGVVREWFGLDVTQDDLTELYKAAPGLNGVVIFSNIDRPKGH